jgi:hypothetical protein
VNTQNVDALADLLEGFAQTVYKRSIVYDPNFYRDFAVWLASQGVLVVGAMTDEEATMVPPFDGEYLSISARDQREAAARHRAALERIAKGA